MIATYLSPLMVIFVNTVILPTFIMFFTEFEGYRRKSSLTLTRDFQDSVDLALSGERHHSQGYKFKKRAMKTMRTRTQSQRTTKT